MEGYACRAAQARPPPLSGGGGWCQRARAVTRCCPRPPPSPCTKRTRLVLPPVLSGHVSPCRTRTRTTCCAGSSGPTRARRCARIPRASTTSSWWLSRRSSRTTSAATAWRATWVSSRARCVCVGARWHHPPPPESGGPAPAPRGTHNPPWHRRALPQRARGQGGRAERTRPPFLGAPDADAHEDAAHKG